MSSLLLLTTRYVNIFFREERLPIEEGWKRSSVPITDDSLRVAQKQIASTDGFVPNPDNMPWVVVAPNGTVDPYHSGHIGA